MSLRHLIEFKGGFIATFLVYKRLTKWTIF